MKLLVFRASWLSGLWIAGCGSVPSLCCRLPNSDLKLGPAPELQTCRCGCPRLSHRRLQRGASLLLFAPPTLFWSRSSVQPRAAPCFAQASSLRAIPASPHLTHYVQSRSKSFWLYLHITFRIWPITITSTTTTPSQPPSSLVWTIAIGS